jgi:hypothetical protein
MKHVVHVQKGDQILTTLPGVSNPSPNFTGEDWDEIECIVRTQFSEKVTGLVQLPGGWIGTPHHPVLKDGAWTHPKHLGATEVLECEYTYSLLLKSRSPTMVVNGWVSGTLAHGVDGAVIGHDYFGTERVVADLKKLPGWAEGIVTITPDDVRRDPHTTFISGIRCPTETELKLVDSSPANTAPVGVPAN